MRHMIGLTQRVERQENYSEKRDCLDQRWQRVLDEIGALIVPIPNDPTNFSHFASAISFSGFILTGGNDLSAYGGAAPERDTLEAQLLQYAADQFLPVLGVCRGMQFMHVDDGGSLSAVKGHVRTRHSLSFQGQQIDVNSYHTWGIHQTSAHFNALCVSEDGAVEAFQHTKNPWIGIMWHPEREDVLADHDRGILESLFK
ncbi:gamma-glutamyl-gamma-aminobutyrate hydrolase family protein [Owenweeksia hongkongensis]|uniref:gamma-glutamyl-gamma-aminobutyrate hydrolase family protein n=1 Tax=Owenweeksia hongkongensis TaxID=253245 RepID=UPI003A8E63E2